MFDQNLIYDEKEDFTFFRTYNLSYFCNKLFNVPLFVRNILFVVICNTSILINASETIFAVHTYVVLYVNNDLFINGNLLILVMIKLSVAHNESEVKGCFNVFKPL